MAFVQTDADLRSLITGARDIIYACDASGHFTYANPFALELMGYPAVDLHGRFVRLRIADSGAGMDWETQSRMFEPFFTTKPQNEGVGLGLSVTYGIVRSCGGSIVVDSRLGQGTTMNIYFPAVTRSA